MGKQELGWWRAHYRDHPLKDQKGQPAWTSNSKLKVYCQECWAHHFASIQLQGAQAAAAGIISTLPRTDEEITSYLWEQHATSINSIGYRISASSTLVNHLARCEYSSAELRDRALNDTAATISTSPARKNRNKRYQNLDPPPFPSAPNSRRSSSQFDPQAGPSFFPADFSNFLPAEDYLNQPGPSNIPSRLSTPAPSRVLSPLIINPASGDGSPASFARSSPSLRPEDSASALSRRSSLQSFNNPPASASPSAFNSLAPIWTTERQKSFESRVARLTASAGLSLSWVDNEEWVSFCHEFIPSATLPSRKVLTNRIIPSLVAELQAQSMAEAKGKDVTLQADGWTGTNHRHLLAFMVTAEEKVYTVRVDDVSNERKTAENFRRLIDIAIRELEEKWGSRVVAVVTDASGECRKARRELMKDCPWIVALDCFAHQVNLVVGDYFKADSDILDHTEDASALITWLRSRTIVLSQLREVQEGIDGCPVLAILRAVLTRWTSHLRAYERLLQVRSQLVVMVSTERARSERNKLIITGTDARAKAKAEEMFDLIQNSLFWSSLTRVVRHLRPLGIAANVIQAAFCRLDTVLLTFGFLIATYQQMTDPDDLPGCTAIMASLERRWMKTDQEIFLAAVILNPFYRLEAFSSSVEFTNAGATALLCRVWKRVFRTDSYPPEFLTQISDYLTLSGRMFSHIPLQCQIETSRAQEKGESPNPINILNSMRHGRDDITLFSLARRILSITANSASCERLFSAYGFILNKYRNRLLVDNMKNQAELKTQIRNEHLRNQQKRAGVRRRFFSQKQVTAAKSTTPLPSLPPPLAPSIDPSSEPGDSPPPADNDNRAHGSFRGIVQDQIARAELDADDLPLFYGPAPLQTDRMPLLPLTEVFDFRSRVWMERIEKMALRTFDQELEFYEMLDLDADGEDDDSQVIDESTAEIIMG